MIWTYDKIAKTSTSLPIKRVAQKSGYYEEADETALGIVKLTLSERTYRVELTSFALIGRHRLPPARR